MSCKDMATGGVYSTWWGRWNYICFNYEDAETMRELKTALSEIVGAVTRVDATIWTREDEGALALAAAELDDDELGKYTDLGWYVPTDWAPYKLLRHLGYPDNERLYSDYPVLTGALARWESEEHSPNIWLLDSSDPRVGGAASPGAPSPPPPEEPGIAPYPPDPDLDPWYPEEYEPAFEQQEARMVSVSPMMLAGAAAALLGLGFAVVYVARS